jgi:hypothetical protein
MVGSMAAARTLIVVVLALAVVLVMTVYVAQRRLIYLPGGDLLTPAAAGVPRAETLTFTAADGVDLDAWYVPAEGEPTGAVLVLPGNAGNRSHRGPLAAALRRNGLATLLVDYRGYGGNAGRPTQDGLLADARAAVAALQQRSGLGDDRLVYFGESLGSGVAAGLTAQRPPAALILRSPFPSLVAVGRQVYPWLPVGALLRDRYPTAEWIAGYDGPTLVVAGDADTLVPLSLSRQLADAAGGPVDVEVVAGAGHNDPALLDGEQMITAITAFLDERTAIDVPRTRGPQRSGE